LLLALVSCVTPSFAVTRQPAKRHPGIIEIAGDAESVMVFHLDPKPMSRCDWDFTDSLRFTHCYRILDHAPASKEWRQDLGDLLGDAELDPWNRDGCGYEPQAIVRFFEYDRTSDLVVMSGLCDSSRVGLLMIRPGVPMEYRELRTGREYLLDMLGDALERGMGSPSMVTARDFPSEGEFVYYDEEPVPVTRIEPVYPEFAKEAQIEGRVTLHVLIGTDGRVASVRVIKGVTGLNEIAVGAVKHWVFRPARCVGKPVAVWVEVPLDFHR